MEAVERAKVEAFLRRRFNAKGLALKPKGRSKDSAEVYIDQEFIGTVSRDSEDDDICWHFTMTILEDDLDS